MLARLFMVFFLAAVMVMACRSNGILVNVNFENLAGIEKGDRVLFNGNTTGHVGHVQYNQEGSYTVQIIVDRGYANAVTEYSRFYVISDPERNGSKSIDIRLDRKDGSPLESGSSVAGEALEKDLADLLQDKLDSGIGYLKEQVDRFGRDLETIPESREYSEFVKSLKDLVDKLEQLEKQSREKIKKKWLPKIQRELDQLRERLKQKGRENELKSLDREVERIRRI